MKEFGKKCKRYLAMFLAVAILLSSGNIGVFAPIHAHAAEQGESVTLGVLIKENFGDELSDEEVQIITSGYLNADKTYSYQMPGDDDDLITVDEKSGKVTAKKYTDPEYGSLWIPVSFDLTDGTNVINGYNDLAMAAEGDVFVGTYNTESDALGNSFTVEVTYSLDLTMSNEDLAAQQEMLDAAYALAVDIALMKHIDAVSVVGDDQDLADKIVDVGGDLIKDPSAIYADIILEFMTAKLDQLDGVSAVDMIYELVDGIEVPVIKSIDFDNGSVELDKDLIRLGNKAGRDAATSLYNQKNSNNGRLDLVAFLEAHMDASYLELLVAHGSELETALTGNYADIEYLSNVTSDGGLEKVGSDIRNYLEEVKDSRTEIYTKLNSYLQDLGYTVNSVADLRDLITDLEGADEEVYATIDEKLSELDADTREKLEEFGLPAKVENADDLEQLKNAVIGAYEKIINTINQELSEMDADTLSKLAQKNAPSQISMADTSSFDAFEAFGDKDIDDLKAMSNALEAIRQDALAEADEKLQDIYAQGGEVATRLGNANAPTAIVSETDVEDLQTALTTVKNDILGEIGTELQDMHAQGGDMANTMDRNNVPLVVTSSGDLRTLKTALIATRADLLGQMIDAANTELTNLHNDIFFQIAESFITPPVPTSISAEAQLRTLIVRMNPNGDLNSFVGDGLPVTNAQLDKINSGVDALDTLDEAINDMDDLISGIETLEDAQTDLTTAIDALDTLKDAMDAFADAKTAVENVKPYISQVLEAQEELSNITTTYIPKLTEAADRLEELDEGIEEMDDKLVLLDMLILAMQHLCEVLAPVNDAFVNDTWNAPKLINTQKNPDYAKLTELAENAQDKDLAAKEKLHVTTAVVKAKLDMYDVTVSYEAVVIDPAKADSTDTIALNTVTHVITLTKGATAQQILAEIAGKVDEAGILTGWAISADNYDRSTTALPEALTENITYTVSYAPKMLTVTFGSGYEAGTAPVQVPFGYRMTLPALDDVTSEYTYTVNGVGNIDQETVITITEDTAISREQGAVSAKQYLTDLVVNTNPGMDSLVKNILLSQALNRGQAISIRVPGKDQVIVAPAANGTSISALPFGSRVGNKKWIAETAVIDGVTVNMVDGVYVETANPGFDKVVVNYELALTAAALGITDEQLLATMNIPYDLVTDYKYQKEMLDALSSNDPSTGVHEDDIMGLLTQLNNQDLVLTSPTEYTLRQALGKIEDLNNVMELGLGAEAIAAAKRLYNIIPVSGYIPLYYTLEQYKEQGISDYYKNEQTYINQITELNDILTVLVADEGFNNLIPDGNQATFETIERVIGEAATLANADNRVNTDLINVSSPYLNTLLTSLDTAANEAQLTKYTQVPDEMIWTASVEQPGPSKRTVTMTVELNGAEKTDSKTVGVGDTITYAELAAWAQSLVRDLGLTQENAAYYVENFGFTGDVQIFQDEDFTANWSLKDYEVFVEGELSGTVNYENRVVTLAQHADPNFQYRYYINGQLYGAGTYTLTLAQFKTLTEGNLVITRELVNLRENALIKLVDGMNGTAVLTKDAAGEYAIILPVDPESLKEDMIDFAIGMFAAEYQYIGLDGKDFYTGKYHAQALIDTVLNSGICTDSLLELIDSEGNVATNLTLEPGTQVLNTVAPDYLDKLGGVVIETTMSFGDSADNTTAAKFYVTLAGSVDQMKTARKALLMLKKAGVTFELNNGRANLMADLPDQAYGAYLAALSLVGETDIRNINDVNAQVVFGYLQDLLEPTIAENVTVDTYANTLAQFGKDVDLSRFSRYFELLKKAYFTTDITYEEDACVVAVENISINAAVDKLQPILDRMELPAGLSVDLSKLVYEYDDPATATDDANAGLSATASVTLENLNTEYAAMFLDVRADGVLNKLGMWTEEELIAGADDFAGASVVVLLDDVSGDLTINTTTLLDLNGKTINGNLTGGKGANLIVIDNTYEQAIPGGVTGTVSGNVTLLDGKYASDVSAFLDNGYYQAADGVVYNQLYTVTADDNGNVTVSLNATPSDVRDLISKKGIVELAIEMAAGLVLNNYNKASLSIENGKVYNININDVVGLFASDSKINAAIDTGLSWISASDLTDIINMFINDLTDFAAIEAALAGDGKLASYTFTTAPWEMEIIHVTDGDYMSLRVGASDQTEDVTLDIVVHGSVIQEAKKLVAALADTVKVSLKADLDDIYRDDDNVIHVSGDAEGIVEIDFTEDPAYVITMAAILADGADAALKAKLEAGIEQYYTQNSLSKLESTFREVTIKQLCDSLGDHSRTENFTSIVNGLNLTATTKTAVLSDVNNDEMGYKYVVDAVGVALRLLQSRGRLESVTQRGVALGTFEDKDETSYYYGFVRDAHIEGVRKVFRSYKLGYDLDVTKLSVKVRLFLDHVHNFVENPDEKYLKAEATCITQAEYYLSCDYEDCGIAHSEKTFFYGDLAPHDYQEIVDDKYLKEEATCTTQAEYYKSCSVCGEAHESETFFYGDLEPHDYKEIVDDKYLKEEATCTTQAEYYKSCSVCGEAHESETFFYGDLEPHDYKEIVDDKYLKEEATCTSPAEYYKSCSVGGEAHATETFFDGEALPHNYVNVVADKYLKNPATCTSPAEYYKSCSVGGEAHPTETFFDGNPLDHTDANNDGLCDHCGETMGTSCNHGQLTHVPANPATTAGNGNKEHWYCPVCNKYFADAAGTQEITQASTVIAALPAVGVPNMPVGGNVYGFLVDSVNNILFADIVKAGMTEQQFKSLLTAAVANDADNKPEIKVTGIASSGLVCTTSKVTLTAENKDGAKVTVTYDIVIIGDTNCNGRIESGDAVKVDRHYRGQIQMTGLEFLAADTNRNNRLESGDAVKIMTKYQNSSRYVTALKK